MNREYVLTTIAHEEPPGVPADLGATPSSGISAIAYNNLKNYLGETSGPTRVYDVVQQLAQPEEIILDRFNIAAIDIGRAFNTQAADWYTIELSDGSTAEYPAWFRPVRQEDGSWKAYSGPSPTPIARMPVGATFFDQTYFPYLDGYPADFQALPQAMDMVLWQALVHSPWDNAHRPDFWDRLRENTIALRQSTDRALVIVCGCNLFEWGTFLRRIDNFLMDLIDQPTRVEALLDALMEIHLSTLEKVCRSVGDIVDIIRFGDDLGTDHGPFMSPAIYRQLFKPRHTALCRYVKEHSSMHTFLHSCGSIAPLVPDLIEAGFEILNPVQTNAEGMDPVYLKSTFGKDIVFWGGSIDNRTVLNRGTTEQVKDHVKRQMDIFAPGGGYVFNTIHNIMPDVPPQNIAAMFEALEEFNR